MIVLRALAHLVAFVLLAALALAGLAVAVFSLGAGPEGLSLPGLASLVRLPDLERLVGTFLAALEGGGVRGPALIGGAIAVVGSLLLLVGALRRPAERLMVLEQGSNGRLAARPRALGQAVGALAETARRVTEAKVRVKPRRRGVGGRIQVTALHPPTAESADVGKRVGEVLGPIAADIRGLKVRTRPETGGRGARAE
ncbi:MAG: hypothetical protein WKF31_10045 [Thermoleophilaceae bacterium]